VAEQAAAGAEDLALVITELERDTTERMKAELPHIPARDLPGALRNLTTSKALQYDKVANPIRGRPSVVVERRDVSELWKRLERLLPQVIEGRAEELSAQLEGNGAERTAQAGQLQSDTDASTARE
jgi:hypothetical protein